MAGGIVALVLAAVAVVVVWALLAPATVVGGLFVVLPILALAIWPLLARDRS